MHIIVDVRTSSPDDMSRISYALLWKEHWLCMHPNDRITFLAHEWDAVDHDDVIRLFRSWYTRRSLASHTHGPDRMISFSELPPIDTSIPLISHVFDLAPRLYPRESLSFWQKRIMEYRQKRLLRNSRVIIVPHVSIGLELSENLHIDEDVMMVIPYLSIQKHSESSRENSAFPYGVYGEYFIAPWSPGNEWNPYALLQAFSQYVHDRKWKRKLIIHGDLWENLSYIFSLIRSLDIAQDVKIFSTLMGEELENLYAHASGWIYIGPYYSRGYLISLAEWHNLPLVLSDIEVLREYAGIHIHSNHIHELPHILMTLEKKGQSHINHEYNDSIMQVYTRLIAEWNLQKS